MNTAVIRRAILQVLNDVAPHALPMNQLLDEVNRRVRPPVADTAALHEHMTGLLDLRYVDFMPDEMDPDNGAANRWLIKETGQAYLKR